VTTPLTVLVVARPGLMRDSLVTFLTAMPEVRVVGASDNAPALLDMILADPADAIVVDVNLGQDAVLALLDGLRALPTPVRCIVLSDDPWQHESFLSAGADVVLVKGFLGDLLRRAVLGGSP
jgi:DNA-binding NarL/FixJ family response regulator